MRADVASRLSRAWPRALVVLLLLACVLVQTTAVQTHIHFVAQPVLGAHSMAQLAKPAGPDSAADCPLCEEAAMAGAYLLPAGIVVPSPPALMLGNAAATIAEFNLIYLGHGWLSRAPPE